MNTLLINIDKNQISQQALQQVKDLILSHHCVAIPTETVYGLAANAWSDDAIKKIFEAKGRPSDNPLIVHVSNQDMLLKCIDQPLTPRIRTLMNRFWPGPLTLVFKKSSIISDLVSASLSTVGIRMPQHPVALAIIETCQVPLAAPSANISGRPSPTKAIHVLEDLNGRIGAIVSSDQSDVGVESTVLDVSSDRFVVLRKGGISLEMLHEVDKSIVYDDALIDSSSTPKSPGQKYKHYAPSKPLTLIEGTIQQQLSYLESFSLHDTLLISVDEIISKLDVPWSRSLGAVTDYDKALNALFDVLRLSDTMNVSSIVATTYPDEGLGATINDRLRKASTNRIFL